MAKTRLQIKTIVEANTGRSTSKDSLINSLCDEALKIAIQEHNFRDAQSEQTTIALTEDSVSVDISAITNLVNLVTATIVDSGSRSAPLILKTRTWWDKNVVNAEDNQKGWPVYGMRYKETLKFDRPVNSDLSVILVASQNQSFSDNQTECPIEILDTFVSQYVTAFVFLSVEQDNAYSKWKRICLGSNWDEGRVGGTLLHAINTDKIDLGEEMNAQRESVGGGVDGISVLNGLQYRTPEGVLTNHSQHGNVIGWF